MSKRRETKLPDRVREILHDEYGEMCAEVGYAGPRSVCRRAMTVHAGEIEPYLRDLGYDRLVQLAAQEFKAVAALAKGGSRQAILPGLEDALVRSLPTVVTVPATHDDEDEFRHIPAELATPSHWREHLEKVLRPQRDGLNGSIAAIAELLERAEACPQDAALIPWLSRRNDPGPPPDPG